MKLSVQTMYLIQNCNAWILLTLLSINHSFSQCESQMTLKLNNIRGGVYPNQTVTLTSLADGSVFTQKSDGKGEVIFDLPCDQKFNVIISNYTRKIEMTSPANNGSWSVRNFGYEPNMAEKDKAFAMNDAQKKAVDQAVSKLPDTTFLKGSMMRKPLDIQNYSFLSLTVKDLDSGPLKGEEVTFSGEKRNISIKGKTNSGGQIIVYLPKGDEYSINFKHNKEYSSQEIRYSKGTSDGRINLSYLGTPEIEKRMREEAERIKAEEERLKREHEEFLKWCKKEGLTESEGYKKRFEMRSGTTDDNVVTKVLNRNHWSEKLIVTDLTGSMDPYANQLSAWYQLNVKKEKNLQFVFFNDGDSKSDHSKVIGSTGGIYYQKAKGLDSLIVLMSKVRHRGNGGDCPENNMEALIKGVKMASPYKELVMIVDNNAPVKDIELLKQFKRPVHIILCGSRNGMVLTDYLDIAWKTKGSIHTIEEDLTKIAAMSEGQSIKVGGITYKIMGGEFVRVSKG